METLKHTACTVGWVARPCRSWLSAGESNPNFPWEKSHWDNTAVKSQKNKNKATCHELFESSDTLGMVNDHDPEPHTCIVQSDRLTYKYVIGALVAVCLHKQQNVFK